MPPIGFCRHCYGPYYEHINYVSSLTLTTYKRSIFTSYFTHPAAAEMITTYITFFPGVFPHSRAHMAENEVYISDSDSDNVPDEVDIGEDAESDCSVYGSTTSNEGDTQDEYEFDDEEYFGPGLAEKCEIDGEHPDASCEQDNVVNDGCLEQQYEIGAPNHLNILQVSNNIHITPGHDFNPANIQLADVNNELGLAQEGLLTPLFLPPLSGLELRSWSA